MHVRISYNDNSVFVTVIITIYKMDGLKSTLWKQTKSQHVE